MDNFSERLKEIEYTRAYERGYKEGYYKALEDFQEQQSEQKRPIQIFIDKDNKYIK